MKISEEKILEEINKAKNNNQLAFKFLLDNFWDSVYNYQLKHTLNDEISEDITIRTFSKAFDKIKTFDENYKFKTWLITISKNEYIDFLRKKKNSIFFETVMGKDNETHKIVDNSLTPEDKIIQEQNLAKLLSDIKKLKPKYQEVINLRFFQELSYKEISEQTSETVSSVKVRLLRAKKLLAEIINKSE